MPELLFEILSEEIPAKMQKKAAENLGKLICDGLEEIGLKNKSMQIYSTPRRLAVSLRELPRYTESKLIKRKGPRTNAPSNAIDGFLKSISCKSLKHPNVKIVKSGKGEFYEFVTESPPKPLEDELPSILEHAMRKLAWPKSMRWGRYTATWIRPIVNILAIFNGNTIEFGYNLNLQVKPKMLAENSQMIWATNKTYGHRFLSPGEILISSIQDYEEKLFKSFVIVKSAERRASIERQAAQLVSSNGVRLQLDQDLLDEVTGLVEWPVVLMGQIDEKFMDLPSEILVASMRSHQKYFSCLRKDNYLADKFILVSNLATEDAGKKIISGNERVLRARLGDAKFFWELDSKNTLSSKLSKLKERVFHEKLGSMADKVDRMGLIAAEIANYIPGCAIDDASRAVSLSKADLSTELVTEFPELQGVVGRYYALNDRETLAIADAIAEHYSPVGPNDMCPSKPVSICVALADKLELLVGLWSIGEKPSGSKDPFALRRAALGVIRLLLENNIRIKLRSIISLAFENLGCKNKKVSAELLSFFIDRLKFYLKDKGMRHDCIDAVFALGDDDLVKIIQRVKELKEFLDSKDGESILVAYRRAANMLRIEERKDNQNYDFEPDPNLFETTEEGDLYKIIKSTSNQLKHSVTNENFKEAMDYLANLRLPLDNFFDQVKVNSSEVKIRRNRLSLLASVRGELHQVADFSLIEG